MGMSLALVFAGGGGKGAYEVGVWKALRESGVEDLFTSVIGTSVGALNALLFGQQNLDTAIRIWREISHRKILVSNIGGQGALTSQAGLKNLLQANLTGNLQKYVYVCCSRAEADKNVFEELPLIGEGVFAKPGTYQERVFLGLNLEERIYPEYIKLNNMSKQKQIEYLLASAALPAVYDPVYIDGKKYRDGGIIREHNMPYQKAIELGYRKVLAVSLEDGVSGIDTLPDGQIYILCPSQSLGKVLDGTVDFDAQNAVWRMELGYTDFMRHKDDILSFLKEGRVSSKMPDNIKVKLKKMV